MLTETLLHSLHSQIHLVKISHGLITGLVKGKVGQSGFFQEYEKVSTEMSLL